MRINNFRKILSINLILMNILSIFNLNQKSFATITETQNQANINITNIEKGVSASLYQIATAEYDYISNQPKEGYKWTSSIQNWIDTNMPEYSNTEDFYKQVENNSEESKEFYDKLTSEIKENNIQIEAYDIKTAEGEAKYPISEENLDGKITFSKVNMGTYLVLIENGYMVYTPSVINVVPSFNSETSTWELNDKDVVVKASKPSITKTVTDNTKTVDNYSTIDDITYTISADVPTYLKNSVSKKYCVSDKLDNSLILNEETLQILGIKVGEEPEAVTGYSINFNSQKPDNGETMTFVIDFDYSKIENYDSINGNSMALLGHSYEGTHIVENYLNEYEIDEQFKNQVIHMIGSHMNEYSEWGALVLPKMLEVIIINYADSMDAYFEPAHDIIKNAKKGELYKVGNAPRPYYKSLNEYYNK